MGMSLVFAVISALIIVLTGLSSDARLTTVLLRSLIGFLLTGALVWLVTFILEMKDIVGFDKNLELIESLEEEEPKSPEEYEAEDEAEDEAAAEQEEQQSEEEQENEPTGFRPLGAEDLRHMEAPPQN
ncbi:hypothetical protein [Selenomonas sp. GACV-9]|uniref:hypothetical protein n=1 Tax=Selenomonas sp. GACV-9 TaxID=3158782 RepID=UPI00296FD20E